MKRNTKTKSDVESKKKKPIGEVSDEASRKSMRSGRFITNGFADPLRSTAAGYAPPKGKVPQMKKATVSRVADVSKFLPTRNIKTKELIFADHTEFCPNLTPSEVIRLGSFGGTYFRDIYSAATKQKYNGVDVYKELPWEDWKWIEGAPIEFEDEDIVVSTDLPSGVFSVKDMLTSETYDTTLNRFGVKCGGSLDMWESSGWMNPLDPYGWFQWYCHFYIGRRSSDDERQIKRWQRSAGPKGRFKTQLRNKCIKANVEITDPTISPVIRQTLQHWGLELRE